MKKILTAISLSALLLAGCDNATSGKDTIVGSKGKGSIPSGYDVVSSDQVDSYTDTIEIVHKDTGQHYTVVRYQGSGIAISPLPSKGDKQ